MDKVVAWLFTFVSVLERLVSNVTMWHRFLPGFLTWLAPDLDVEFENRYVYTPIESSGSIRLFHLDAGEGDDEISGHLVHVSFTEVLEYESLSYTWGSAVMKHPIITPDGVIPMTTSLKSALVRLRLPDQVRVLWVDAICINQRDNEEKSHQILLMPLIYSIASKVVAYLGDEADGSDIVADFLERISKTDFGSDEVNSVFMAPLVSCGLPPPGAAEWIAFGKFWCRPWFGRIWILQEFLLAKDVTIICGKWERPWEVLFEATKKTNNCGLVAKTAPNSYASELEKAELGVQSMLHLCLFRSAGDTGLHEGGTKNYLETMETGKTLGESMNIPTFRAIGIIRDVDTATSKATHQEFIRKILDTRTEGKRTRTFMGMNLKLLIEHSKSCRATDPRDLFFALLSLANDLNNEDLEYLKPDYNKPIEWVACRYASMLTKKGQGMDMLYNASPPPSSSNFPSWLGGWDFDGSTPTNSLPLGVREKGLYNAGGDTTANVIVMKDSDVLASKGGCVDFIATLGSGSVLQPNVGTSFPMVANLMLSEADQIFSSLDSRRSYPTGETLYEVQWRTLIANRTATTNEEPGDIYGLRYTIWRELIKGMYLARTPEERMKMSPPYVLDYFQSLVLVQGYKLCVTQTGLVGLVPLATKQGDCIVILLGGRVPFVLRPSTERPGMFTFVGGCYIHGLMKGEATRIPGWQEIVIAIH